MRAQRLKPDGTVRPATDSGKVRWLANGLLDVGRKGQYLAMIDNNSHSHLLQMPAEVRNKIYAYALGGHKYCPYDRRARRRYDLTVALLLVCRQIYAEAALIPFQKNDFAFSKRFHLSQWLKNRLPVQRAAITTVIIHTDLNLQTNRRAEFRRKDLEFPPAEFPSLKSIHFRIYDFCVEKWRYIELPIRNNPSCKENKEKFEKWIKEVNDKVKVTFPPFQAATDEA